MTGNLVDRFQGDAAARRRLVEALRTQVLLNSDPALADAVADSAELRELAPGDVLMRQDDTENDVSFVLCGAFRVFVNNEEIAVRGIGQHLGEMAIVDPSATRSATVIAAERSVVARLSEAAFVKLADEHSIIWRATARELCRRLDARKRFHRVANTKPIVFIGSAKECLPIANALRDAIPDALATATLWSQGGVFGASSFTIVDLEAQLKVADFAVLVAGADDQVTSRGTHSDAPRDNVILELGLFMGAIGRGRTFLAVPKHGAIKIPTDLLGLTLLRWDERTDPVNGVAEAVKELCRIIESKGAR